MKRVILISLIVITVAIPRFVFATPVPDTGQTKCYDNTKEIACPSPGQPFYGQDGNYNINQMSYNKLNEKGFVLPDSASSWAMLKDNVTGLVWEIKTNYDGKPNYGDAHDADNSYTWYDSNPATNGGYVGTPGDGTDTEDFIKSLNKAMFGGFSDWRLPTIKELSYIVNHNIPYPGPTIYSSFFSNTPASWHWSGTTNPYDSNYAWGINFYYGNDGGIFDYGKKSYNYYVRAVRDDQSESFGQVTDSANSYADNGDGTVTDITTGIMWQKDSSSGEMNWEKALEYCEELNLGGYTDWRLPNKKELRSLVDYSRYYPTINTTYFPNTAVLRYWSCTTNESNIANAWLIDFGYGNDSSARKYYDNYVRAVRGRQTCSLVVSPLNSNVSNDSGATTFDVTNAGIGTMPWTVSVISGGDWLTITSGSSGVNNGTITCDYGANSGTTNRKTTIHVTAIGANGSPADVTVTQAATTTKCTAEIDSGWVLHIPLISHLVPWLGAPSYWVDMVYEYNTGYPALIPFKLTNAALAQSGVYDCNAATMSDDFKIHIPDLLMPDGVTRIWLDLEYSKALSTNDSVYFVVTGYGAIGD